MARFLWKSYKIIILKTTKSWSFSNKGKQPFILPPDVYLDSSEVIEHNQCVHRFLGEAQVAQHNYENPEMIPAHVIVFDEDTLGVIFLDLQSISIYKRLKEDLTTIYYDDI